ncbi:MAG TPA: succinate dehydrogenase, hydrophobic membrane anchor protein [Gammaproteobacteria bacterium]|nr:succinate dehydrogenase, hydrophobic membrane anchor protein [Gammaproteobacteria bacterium]
MTPLNRVLGLGSAKSGAEHWWLQRVTAAALAALGLWLAIAAASLPDYAFATVIEWVRHPTTAIMLFLIVITASYHSYLGVRVVFEDYVHGAAMKTVSLVLSFFAHFAVAVIGVYSVAKIAFGSPV